MISLRSCCCYYLPLSLKKQQHFLSLKKQYFLFSNPNHHHHHRTMSARPSAFDALMSGARAAAKKKPSVPVPSPKKRKVFDSTVSKENPSTPNTKQTLESVESNQDREISDYCVKLNSSPSRKGVKSEKVEESSPKKSNSEKSLNSIESSQNGVFGKKMEKPSSRSPVKVKLSKLEDVERVDNVSENPDFKKPRLTTVKERTFELKSKMDELKKKPADFDPKSVASWNNGERVPFLFIALVFDMISKESGRILITDIVCNMLRTVIQTTPDDMVQAVYLSANRIAPAHEGVELGIGDASIIKALAEAYGGNEVHIKKQYNVLGDLGLVAKASRSSQSMMRKPEPLTVVKVFDTFQRIAKESGRDSQEKKKNHIRSLLVAATDCEPQYLIRLLQGKLRIGLAEQTLLSALGQAAVYSEKHSTPPPHVQSPLEEAAKMVKQVYSVLPVYDKIITALLTDGVWNLTKTCSFTPGVPVGPMLAKPTKGVSEILDKFQDREFTCEYKYDGERAQIHYMNDRPVEIYSRNAERNTGKFPDVLVAVSRLKKPSVTSFILDCELVAYDREKKKILSFQVLSTRARKNVAISDIKVEVCIFAFDILYLNGQQLIQEELKLRRQHLYDSFEEEPGYFQFATAKTSTDLEEIQKFLEASVDSSCEGLIIKTLGKEATYEPSKRSHNWLKLKKDYMDSIGDSLDLVPIAAFHGRGKRTGGYGAFLLACYDSANEEFQSICKIGTGFSEAVLEERSASLKAKVISKPKSYYRYGETLNPDVWFEPTEVWEVKAADLTISPVHCAATGVVDPDKGISLRFPRLVRIREDKIPEQASSSEQVAEMYNAQKHNHQNNKDDDEDD